MKRRSHLGFTIVELMVATSVAMIVLGVGVPSFVGIVRSNQTVTEINDLAGALNLARSEAIGRGVEVTIAPLVGTDWSTGWAVGIDTRVSQKTKSGSDRKAQQWPRYVFLAFVVLSIILAATMHAMNSN